MWFLGIGFLNKNENMWLLGFKHIVCQHQTALEHVFSLPVDMEEYLYAGTFLVNELSKVEGLFYNWKVSYLLHYYIIVVITYGC